MRFKEDFILIGRVKPIEYVKKGRCWVCVSHAVRGKGYPVLERNGKRYSMNRYVYMLRKGDVGSMHVRHTCDNMLCINPNHLILGTNADNMRDRGERGRVAKGESNGKSKLLNEDVRIIYGYKGNYVDLMKKYGISYTEILAIKKGDLRRDATGRSVCGRSERDYTDQLKKYMDRDPLTGRIIGRKNGAPLSKRVRV